MLLQDSERLDDKKMSFQQFYKKSFFLQILEHHIFIMGLIKDIPSCITIQLEKERLQYNQKNSLNENNIP